jgi:hypothetical protein
MVGAHSGTTSSNSKCRPVQLINEGCIQMEQLHNLGVSAQRSPVPCISRHRIAGHQELRLQWQREFPDGL